MAKRPGFRPHNRAPLRDTLPFLTLMPNLVTIIGLCAGLTSIRYVFEGRFDIAAALLIFAAIVDGLDGLVARKLNAASDFGAELDSLSDFVNFGVAPALLLFEYALKGASGVGWMFVLVFAVCGCLRLARFNVNRDAPNPGGRVSFVGVPAPAGAMLALLPVFLGLAGVVDLRGVSLPVAIYLGLVGVLMISRLPTPSIKGIRVSRDRVVWVLIGMSAVIGLALTKFWLLAVILILIYVGLLIYSVVGSLRKPRAEP